MQGSKSSAPYFPNATTPKEYLDELTKASDLAPSFVNPAVPIIKYYQAAQNVFLQGYGFREEGDIERAYFSYLRLTGLVVYLLPKHPDYNKKSNERTRDTFRGRIASLIDEMEQMKKWIKARFLERQNSSPASAVLVGDLLGLSTAAPAASTAVAAATTTTTATAAASTVAGAGSGSPIYNGCVSAAMVYDPSIHSLPPATVTAATTTPIPMQFSAPASSPPSNVSSPSTTRPHPSLARSAPGLSSATEAAAAAATIGGGPIPVSQGMTPKGGAQRTVIVHGEMFTEFMQIVNRNTARGIETCGILCGKLYQGNFHINAIVIPKQTGTTDTCGTTEQGEVELFEYQMANDLLTLGWVHTHPNHTCFLSSVDIHTQLAYQLMMDEAIAIVLAPKFKPNFGIFCLTKSGIEVVKRCNLKGFHPHKEQPAVYQHSKSTHLAWKQPKSWKIIDLR